MQVRKLDPETNFVNYCRIYDRGIHDGKLTLSGKPNNATQVLFEHKRDFLRYVIYLSHHIDLFNRLHADAVKFAKLANHKLEMCLICLLHLEMRVGENLIASLYQIIIQRVRTSL